VFNVPVAPADAVVFRFERTEPGADGAKIVGEPPVQWDPSTHFARIGKALKDRGDLADEHDGPHAVYSTPTARTADNKDKEPGLPEGAEPFPDGFWLEVKQGEATCGFFKLKDGARGVCFSNPNRYAWQGMLIVPKQDPKNPTMIWELDQAAGRWAKLGTWGDVNFPLLPAGSAVFKFKQQGAAGKALP
jgi:hypothetical protein